MESYGSFYHVDLGERVVPCVLRGKFRKEERDSTNPVVVGDEVEIALEEENQGVIKEILPRRTQLSRPSPRDKKREHLVVANVSQAVIVASPQKPKVPLGFIDRVLIACQDYEIQPLLCVNKVDLVSEREDLENYREVYGPTKINLLFVSAKEGENIDGLREALKGQISVFVGQSGVGKSSLLNALEPTLELKVGRVSSSNQKGRHTTTYASLLKLTSGGYVVDTPGLKEFGLREIPLEELSYFFPEMEIYLAQCKFKSCLHRVEPECQVRRAVEDGKIHPERYKNYCQILDSLESKRKW